RPEIDSPAFTTAATPAPTSPSAATRSRSRWLMTAMSPGWSRFTRSLVRRSIRAVPVRVPAVRLLRRAMGPRPLEARARVEQLSGVAAGVRGLTDPREHARQLPDSLLADHRLGARHRALPLLALLDHDLRVCVGRHLREVRHHQHLVGA